MNRDTRSRRSIPNADVCLIAEKGTDWGSWMESCRARGLTVAAIIQSPFERIEIFAARVRDHLEAIGRVGGAQGATVLVGAKDWEPSAIRARCDAVRAIAESMKGEARLRLVLTCDTRAGSDDVAGVNRLATYIAADLAGYDVEVTCKAPRETLEEKRLRAHEAVQRVLAIAAGPVTRINRRVA